MSQVALIMAGGTGGHIFPGLAVADGLRQKGWQVHWLGAPEPSMESQLVPPKGYTLWPVDFAGVRGKGWRTLLKLPARMWRAMAQSRRILRQVRPQVVVGLGGYITVPGGLSAWMLGVPLILHEQNSIAGMANRWLARLARKTFSAFPDAIPQGEWVGNPLRQTFLNQPEPARRFQGRTGPLQVLVVGGSLGAQALNEVVPKALALMPAEHRPRVIHQSGARQIEALQANYAQAGVQAELTPFIDDTAQAFAQADLVICRAGASTVTELAAVGVAALFVPFPHAVDDHQTHNARFLADRQAAWWCPQSALTPEALAERLRHLTRDELCAMAQKAFACRQTQAADRVVQACQEVAA
jgi:UDP-N-acetylglucosamine--N-acetylmuramyl-(pentapeptide) pyrophosphoryl-undecaprenol N-acetylglucosamine transferase